MVSVTRDLISREKVVWIGVRCFSYFEDEVFGGSGSIDPLSVVAINAQQGEPPITELGSYERSMAACSDEVRGKIVQPIPVQRVEVNDFRRRAQVLWQHVD